MLPFLFNIFFFLNDTHYVVINFDDGFYSIYQYAYPLLLSEKIPFTIGLITKTLSWRRHNYSPYSYLTIPEIKEMVSALNCEIASHSVNHQDLTKLDSLSAQEEISRSKKELEAIFQRRVSGFIYPYGRYNQNIIRWVVASNYAYARSVNFGEANFFSPYQLSVKEVRRKTKLKEVLNFIKRNRFSILLFHRIVLQPKYFTDYGIDDFKILITTLKSNPEVKFLTLEGLAQKWLEELLEKTILPRDRKKRFQFFQKVAIDILSYSKR